MDGGDQSEVGGRTAVWHEHRMAKNESHRLGQSIRRAFEDAGVGGGGERSRYRVLRMAGEHLYLYTRVRRWSREAELSEQRGCGTPREGLRRALNREFNCGIWRVG